MNDEQSQNGQDESFVREAAKAVALGAVLGAAVGAVTAASREAAEKDEPEAPEASEAPEAEAQADVEEPEEGENVAEAEEYEEPESAAPEEPADEPDKEPQAHAETQSDDEEPQEREEPQPDDGSAPAGLEIVQRAKRQLAELTGRSPEGVLGFEQADDGWRVTLEVVELSRTPSSTDVMAAYDVLVDDSGDVRQWRRTRRYIRSQAESEEVA
jgi:outer membrane biosynthesis protein TonB